MSRSESYSADNLEDANGPGHGDTSALRAFLINCDHYREVETREKVVPNSARLTNRKRDDAGGSDEDPEVTIFSAHSEFATSCERVYFFHADTFLRFFSYASVCLVYVCVRS